MDFGFFEGFKMGIDLLWGMLVTDPVLTSFFLVSFFGTIITAIIIKVLRERKLRKSGILDVDQMSGRKFEEFLQALLKARGYQVQLTPATGDFGADLVLMSKDKKIVVQAKRYKKNVGVKAVQEIATAKSHYNADECWVITNSFFTAQAKRLASSNQVKLIDRKQLVNWMLEGNRVA